MISQRGLPTWRVILAVQALILLPSFTDADDFPLSRFPYYTQATGAVGSCVASVSSRYSTSWGCPEQNPATCLCTDASKSQLARWEVGDCLKYNDASDRSTGTELWGQYCTTNGGVFAQDETAIQDLPFATQAPSIVVSCLRSATASAVTTWGCTDYTVASCLCQTSASSSELLAAMQPCLKYEANSIQKQDTATRLWRSYCDANSKSPATRSVGTPLAVSVTVTSDETATGQSSKKTGGATGTATKTSSAKGTTTITSDNSNKSSGGLSSGAKAGIGIGATFGALALIAGLGLLLYRRRKKARLEAMAPPPGYLAATSDPKPPLNPQSPSLKSPVLLSPDAQVARKPLAGTGQPVPGQPQELVGEGRSYWPHEIAGQGVDNRAHEMASQGTPRPHEMAGYGANNRAHEISGQGVNRPHEMMG